MKREYRRGVELNVFQKLWHCNQACKSFPTRNFAVRRDKPSDDELCARCCSLDMDSQQASKHATPALIVRAATQ